jgi:hypothetical protein
MIVVFLLDGHVQGLVVIGRNISINNGRRSIPRKRSRSSSHGSQERRRNDRMI